MPRPSKCPPDREGGRVAPASRVADERGEPLHSVLITSDFIGPTRAVTICQRTATDGSFLWKNVPTGRPMRFGFNPYGYRSKHLVLTPGVTDHEIVFEGQ